MLWQVDELANVSAALDAARDGHPTLLTIVGHAGMGKSSLLGEIVRRATGFNVVDADGEQSRFQEPFTVLRQLGVDDVLMADGRPKDPIVAAQGLREVLDSLNATGPTLFVIDDLQWVDRESVESLFWLFRRARGDRLLIVVAARPDAIEHNESLRRVLERTGSVVSMRLDGLSIEQAIELVRSIDPEADDTTTHRLWEHTSGNPFYIRALVEQYGTDELAKMRSLPSPSQFTGLIRKRLESLSDDAVQIAYASATLGDGWTDLPTLAAVAGLVGTAAGRQELLDSGILKERSTDPASPVRASHALVRAAIYQVIPFSRRRDLHLMAAQVLSDPMAVLEHRVSAADTYDTELADELQATADQSHERGDYRQASRIFTWSSRLTAEPERRNRRWLESVFNSLLARDITYVRQHLEAVRSSSDLPRGALIQGLYFVAEKEWLDALAAFSGVDAVALESADSITRYRLRVLTAWSMIGVGRPTNEIAPHVNAIIGQPVADRALVGYSVFAAGMLALRQEVPASVQSTISAVPPTPFETSPGETYKLAWRGSLFAMWGESTAAEADLLEVTTRIRSGMLDIGDGVYSGLLAFSRWQSGAWNLAGIDMGAALDSAIVHPHPMNRAIEPMLLAVRGDFERADARLREAETVLQLTPWREAIHLLVISEVVRAHADGSEPEMRGLWSRLRGLFGDPLLEIPGYTGSMWPLHMALAAIWAHDLDNAEKFIAAIREMPATPRWAGWVVSWLSALAAEHAGDDLVAVSLLEQSVVEFDDCLPLYRAHVLADLARLLRNHDQDAVAVSNRAEDLYRSLGAVPYLSRAVFNPDTAIANAPTTDVFSPLSDRERDVATLVIEGLSYAQISRELFITRATVGFHLGRIYAKTGVASRHELVDVAHRNSVTSR